MEITSISVQIHYSVFFHSLPLVSLPDKGNQENFSDCQTLKEKANVKQMKISDSKDFYTKDNNWKELLLTADTFRTELSLKLSRWSWLIYISDIFLSSPHPASNKDTEIANIYRHPLLTSGSGPLSSSPATFSCRAMILINKVTVQIKIRRLVSYKTFKDKGHHKV